MPSPTDQARFAVFLRSERAMGLRAIPLPMRSVATTRRVASVARPAGAPPARPMPPLRPSVLPRPMTPPPPRVAAPPMRPPAPPRFAEAPIPQTPSLELLMTRKPLPAIDFSKPFDAPLLSTEPKRLHLTQLDQEKIKLCTLCGLSATRTNTVLGEGDVDARLLFIGEGPGETEDLSGRPFVGKAGQMLDKMIAGMGLKREQVYICNIVKCRPPLNRAPAPEEVVACTPYLLDQLEAIRPLVIVTLGLPATHFMLQTREAMGRLRGVWHTWHGIRLMPTYHPSYVIRSYTPDVRAAVWSDLKQVMVELGLPPAKRTTASS